MLRVASASLATRRNGGQYLFILVAFFTVQYTDHVRPFRRSIYHLSDAELWRYSYPLLPNHVPAWVVPLLSLSTPFVIILGFHLAGRLPRLAAHHGVVQGWAAVVITGLITNLIKLNVARPRPDFVARCWPGGATPAFTSLGVPLCSAAALDWEEGLKSFPSGHTAWSSAGLGYASLWLLGALRCFDGAARPARLAVALLPLALAGWVGMTRLQDCWHHTEDVLAGLGLGLAVAWACYRGCHCPVTGQQAGCLTLLAEEGVWADSGLAPAGLAGPGGGIGVPVTSASNLPGLMGARYNSLAMPMPEEDV
ncbi:Lipid phosphate phosphatase 2 [Auxenochlorella protothecoides]|uniref:Lipid phosphate phosphatase 2 n=1 Tax=Auxenochlorella protothecoides TaxID=3075 RepID=A0A087SCH4_AUXPR|nr:Lipid phosphate phosphatase 2 [Auxenochlorella protothecoides]KFM23428.1 Lipid phosphate phosphatase 2 [Auxenochlorella protothecoides]